MQKGTVSLNEIDYQTRLAPAASWDQGKPVINSPEIYGASPGKEFLYLIPTVGERPIRFAAENLPEGLTLELDTGRIIGKAAKAGEYTVKLMAENSHGKCEKQLKLVIRENALSLTPPMGWNSWNCYRSSIDEKKILKIADSMITSGLAARGYNYVNLDSGWQSKERGEEFNSILPHDGFPDMKELCDHIHALGLKAGIYSGPYATPWGTQGAGSTSGLFDTSFSNIPYNRTWTRENRDIGKYIGLDKHESDDVCQWDAWGFDYFKYDWSHTEMVTTERMARELRNASRDIVYSITTAVSPSDADRVKELANLWRNNSDSMPIWESVVRNGFDNQEWNAVIGPGHWYDLDMMALLPRYGKELNRNEMIACLSCWMMRPSPILIDYEPFTMSDTVRNLLCNEEIIAVNQDALGKPAASIRRESDWDIQIKPLADGTYALAFFNLGKAGIAPPVHLDFFGVPERFRVRDLWAREDLGEFDHSFIVGVDTHCAKVFKLYLE